MRKLVVEGSEYKVVHQELLCNLLLLSTSAYSQVKVTTRMNTDSSVTASVASQLHIAVNINISGALQAYYECMHLFARVTCSSCRVGT